MIILNAPLFGLDFIYLSVFNYSFILGSKLVPYLSNCTYSNAFYLRKHLHIIPLTAESRSSLYLSLDIFTIKNTQKQGAVSSVHATYLWIVWIRISLTNHFKLQRHLFCLNKWRKMNQHPFLFPSSWTFFLFLCTEVPVKWGFIQLNFTNVIRSDIYLSHLPLSFLRSNPVHLESYILHRNRDIGSHSQGYKKRKA